MVYLTMHSTHFIYCYMDYSFRLAAKVFLYAPSHRQDYIYQSEREIAQCVPPPPCPPIRDRSNDPSHHDWKVYYRATKPVKF